MIPFRSQLRILLWKGSIIKRRQKFWLAVELLVPIILFVILVLIRTRNFSLLYPLCHYNSRAFTSAGLLPFINGFMCSFLNPCNSIPVTGDEMETLNTSPAATSLLIDGIQSFTSQLSVIGENPKEFATLLNRTADLIHALANMNSSAGSKLRFEELFVNSFNLPKQLVGLGLSPALAGNMSKANLTRTFYAETVREGIKMRSAINETDVFSLLFGMFPDQIVKPMALFCDPAIFSAAFEMPSGYSMTQDDAQALCAITPFLLYQAVEPKDVNLTRFAGSILGQSMSDPNFLSNGFNASMTLMAQPLFVFGRRLYSLGSHEKLIATLTCGQGFDVSKSGGSAAAAKQNEKPNPMISNQITMEILNFVRKIAPGHSEDKASTNCSGIPLRKDVGNCSLLEQSGFLRPFSALFQGRILVSPASPVVDELIRKLSEPLRHFAFFSSLFPEYSIIAPALQKALNNSDVPAAGKNLASWLREVTNGTSELASFIDELDTLVESLSAPPDANHSFTNITRTFAKTLIGLTECMLADRFVSVKDETHMEEVAVCLQPTNQYLSATSSLNDLRRDVSRDSPFVDLKYVTFGFSFLQEAIDRTLIGMMTGKRPRVGVYSQQEPYPCVSEDQFDVTAFLGLFTLLSWMIPCAMLVKNIVHEKEQRLKELMRIMGLGDSIHFLSWAIIAFLLQLVSIFIIILLLKVGRILPNTDISLLACFFILFSIAIISQSLLITTFFSNANIATACTCIVHFLFSFPFQLSLRSVSVFGQRISLILPQSTMCYGLYMIGYADKDFMATWAKYTEVELGLHINLSWVLNGFLVEIFFYNLLAWYISAIHPGVHGVSLPWNFCFLRRYWFPDTVKSETSYALQVASEPESDAFEKDPTEEKLTVLITDLIKDYSNGMRALDGLNLRMYESQITGLLGHNGAGKTTTMSILCGLFSPSAGTAHIYGEDIRYDMRSIRDVLGYCPQHNVLFDLVTVYEQLKFYAALKGVASADLHSEIMTMMQAVDLVEKKDYLSGKLSGGQKRRLSIGIALVGGSKFVILDEPTAGVDVNSRKDIWRLLIKNKIGRTILLSTHHMDEADVLSDRVAILSEGRLKALGSSVFLKNRFGQFLTLTLVKKTRKETNSDIVELLNGMNENVKVFLADCTDDEITLNIPISTDSMHLEVFFRTLDAQMEHAGVAQYGVSAPSLEQIFVSLAPQGEMRLNKVSETSFFSRCCGKIARKRRIRNTVNDKAELIDETGVSGDRTEDIIDASSPIRATKVRKQRHMLALFKVRWCYTKRSARTLFCVVCLPILLLLAAELYAIFLSPIGATGVKIRVQGSLPLVSAVYGNYTTSYINLVDRSNQSLSPVVAASFMGLPGMGWRCLEDSPWRDFLPSKCMPAEGGNLTVTSLMADASPPIKYNVNATCNYAGPDFDCRQADYPLNEQRWLVTNTTDIVLDMSYRNLSQFRLMTHFLGFLQEESTSGLLNIMSGYSLGHRNPRAISSEAADTQFRGWRSMLTSLSRATTRIKLNTSSIPPPPPKNDTFVANITLDGFMKKVLHNMDSEENIKIWFDNKRWAALPVFTNILSNALLRLTASLPDDSEMLQKVNVYDSRTAANRVPDRLGIITHQHPMNQTLDQVAADAVDIRRSTFRAILIVLVMSIIPGSFVIPLVEDRITDSYHLQIVSGLSRRVYWVSAFLFDNAVLSVSALIILLMYTILNTGALVYNSSFFFAHFLLFVIYGLGTIPFVYILQRRFGIPAIAFVLISLGMFFFGAVTSLTILVLERIISKDASDTTIVSAYNICAWIFLILPQYNLVMGVARGGTVYTAVAVGEQLLKRLNRPDLISKIPIPALLQWNLMGMHIFVLFIESIVFIVVFAILEHGKIGLKRRVEKMSTIRLIQEIKEEEPEEDFDVSEERIRVLKLDPEIESEGLIVKGLAKAFNNKLVVKEVTFCVERGECFGLLGLNGAGKTTTFAMMTGKTEIGNGEVLIRGQPVTSRASDGFRFLGYCPQFDALNMKLTTREHVEFYARIHGIEETLIPQMTSSLLRVLHLLPYADIVASRLSGGNKRKLSVAVALISQPPVIMLDEPSAGMDPNSQQFLWSVVNRLRKSGRSVVLTSHSMEECEALCTRIAILDQGKIKCIGSKQHLKNKFGDGFSLNIKLSNTSEAERASEFVIESLPGSKLVALHCTVIYLHISKESITVADILAVVNKMKEQFAVEDFSLSQTTLDEIFQSFGQGKGTDSSEVSPR